METGTGKTLVYLRTAYKLYEEYKLTAWRASGDGFKWKETNGLKPGDNVAFQIGLGVVLIAS